MAESGGKQTSAQRRFIKYRNNNSLTPGLIAQLPGCPIAKSPVCPLQHASCPPLSQSVRRSFPLNSRTIEPSNNRTVLFPNPRTAEPSNAPRSPLPPSLPSDRTIPQPTVPLGENSFGVGRSALSPLPKPRSPTPVLQGLKIGHAYLCLLLDSPIEDLAVGGALRGQNRSGVGSCSFCRPILGIYLESRDFEGRIKLGGRVPFQSVPRPPIPALCGGSLEQLSADTRRRVGVCVFR